jgi:methionine aminopeptidase
MSDDSPIATAFELQRRALEQSGTAIEQSIEFQKRLNDAVASGMAGQAEAQQRSMEVTRSALNSYLDTIESVVPGADVQQVRDAIDEQFEAVETAGEEAVSLTEESMSEYENASEAYLDAVQDQLDVLAEAHEDMESQTETFLDETEAQLESLQDETEAQFSQQIEEIQQRARELRESVSND